MELRLFKKRKNNLKNITIYILTFIISSSVAQREINVIQKDFDDDGLEEELIIHTYLDEVDYAIIKYEQGSKKCTLNVNPKINTPTLINTVPLCDDLLMPKYKKLAKNINIYVYVLLLTKMLKFIKKKVQINYIVKIKLILKMVRKYA